MSGVWEEAEELYNYGLNGGPDTNVCASHFEEPAIRSFIKKSGIKEQCDYCGKLRNTVPLEKLMKFLMDTVKYFYTDPINFANYISSEDGYQVIQTDAWNILQEDFGLEIDNDQLLNDMESWIDFDRTWADQKAMHSEGHYARPESWSHFCDLVKHKVRYLFQNYVDNSDRYTTNPIEILKESERMVNKYRLVKMLPTGTKVFRCRQHNKSEIITEDSQMCAPKTEFCKSPNRMSSAGISLFYCAFDIPTTLSETLELNWKGTKYTTVSFETVKDIHVVDLSILPSSPSYFDKRKRKRFEDLVFLRDFVNDLTKSIERDERVHVEYVPTQIVTEFFRFMGKQKVDGIIYPSSRNPGHNAMVLFYNHYESLENLKFKQETLSTKNISSYKPAIIKIA